MNKHCQTNKTVIATLRLPADLYALIRERVRTEDIDFSKYVRRAIRREMAGTYMVKAESDMDV